MSSLVVIRLSCFTIARVFSTFSLDRAESGRPGRVSFSSDAPPFEKAQTVGRLVHDSVSQSVTIQVLILSVAVFPDLK